ncbi:MAG: RNA 2'-phosphotransferase [Candidatus Lokiarchaeota archaeon]|nr:RNA 2'-phosphotransferase [Candidatus Lokiarchaeota archaeon]
MPPLIYFYCNQCDIYLTNKEVPNHRDKYKNHNLEKIFTDKQRVKLSKLLSFMLRHNPQSMGIHLMDNGLTEESLDEIITIIKKNRNHFEWLSKQKIRTLVEIDKKGRFEIINNRIRARYGHSIPRIKIDLKEKNLPNELFHGTNLRSYEKIRREGLKPMGRNLVHLTSSLKDAKIVGTRHRGQLKILKINVKNAINEGYKIWRAGKNVFVSNYIPSKYIRELN